MINRITYDELKSKYANTSFIPYYELIKTKEWFDRRQEIIDRDNLHCSQCGKFPTTQHYENGKTSNLWFDFPDDAKRSTLKWMENGVEKEFTIIDPTNMKVSFADKEYYLHVHHKFYTLDKLPWEYEDQALITLCNWCHWEFHEMHTVCVFKTDSDRLNKIAQLKMTPCFRCNGAGCFPQYNHIEAGICFRCRGALYEELVKV